MPNSRHTEARAMLDVFVGVGAGRFDMTWTNTAGDKERFRGNVSPAELARSLPEILGDAICRQRSA